MTDNSLLEDFADETREHLEELESSLLRLEAAPADQELLNTIFRSMHTIKGASEYLGFERIARLTHRLENLMDLFRDGSLHADKVAMDLLIDARDRIGDLISQVEESGQESAEIDDLLDRVDAIASSPTPAGGEAEAVYEGEADTELFDIFIEQLATGIEQLMETAGQMARGEAVAQAAKEMADQVDRLAGTANYMGYDALSAVYDDMLAALETFSSRSEAAGANDIDELLQSAIVSGVARIQDLFPNAESLKKVDTRIAVQMTDGEPASIENNDLGSDEENDPGNVVTDDIEGNPNILLEVDKDLDLEPEDAAPKAPIPQEADNSLLEDFADETREHLEELESSLLCLEAAPADQELLNTIFRSMHTIKGASEYLGFERIARLTHRLENLLDLFRDGSLHADKLAVDLLIDARDRIGDLISQVEESGQESAEIDDLLDRVDAIASSPTPAGGEAEAVYEGEADTELFDIFIEQLATGIEQLMETAGQMARGEAVAQVAKEMADQVDRLAGTANYMGDDALSAVYDDMLAALETFSSRSEAAGANDIDELLQSAIVSGVARIQDLFPNAESLKKVDTRIAVQMTDGEPASIENNDLGSDEENDPGNVVTDDIEGNPNILLEVDKDLDLEPEDAAPKAPIPQEADNSLLEDFADETREHLEELESSLLRLEAAPADQELLNTIFRSMHTIKGASEYLGFERIARLTHRLENLLDLFRDGSLHADKLAVDLLIDARDRIGDLISQVEESGQESAEIDDLLDRVDAIASSPTPAGGEAEAVYEGEADTELFDIFIEQLATGIEQLMETAGQMARGEAVAQAAKEMADQVDRLAGTANYMGYDALSAVYDDMLAALETFSSRSEAAGADDIDELLQSAVVSGVARIQGLFPDAESLAAIDTDFLTAAPVDDAPSIQTSESDPPPSSDVALLLAGLPAIDDDERESLLSKTLDETFSSMRINDNDSEDVGGTQADEDPIAMQFSSDADEADYRPPPSQREGDRDEALAILDDFGADQNDVTRTLTNRNTDESIAWQPAGSDGDDADLWPEATSASIPAPDMPAKDMETTARVIDFSTPTPSETTAAEESVPETVSARSTIRKSIRVDADKVDDLMNQVGELVVNRSSFTQLFAEMREMTHYLNHRFTMDKADQRLVSGFSARLNDATTVLGRVSSELQEQVMKVRMLPISRLFNRYPRLVHDLVKDSNKKIQLQFRGEETELDRMVIEQLADPMIHIIRNAVDHGIEARDDRKSNGKPESGVLLLEAYHEGSNVIIEVTDDGKGIDLSRIRQKAVEKQLADRETLERMDQQALIDMIMLPGFSTTDQVTHTSGRGVGMDVVKRNIEKINGTLIVDTRQDVGTRIRIKIPLTLAIIPALMIRCGGSHITVPLSAVQETFRLDQGEIFTVDGSEMMHLHDEPLSLVRLTDLLNMPALATDKSDGRFFVVVVKAANGRTGFIVDKLLGRQEVVIKPLEDYLQENSGFSGATILGDGSISLILNVDELVVMAKEWESERRLTAAVL